ncbi:MAG: AraC family transcriptional regulator ligand-binding domain-containing protein, partial [Notoacmeibacter sp.]
MSDKFPEIRPDSFLKSSYIRGTFALGFREFIAQAGGNADDLLLDVGIPLSIIEDVDQLVSYSALVRLLEIAAQRFSRPSIGLEWSVASAPDFAELGPLTLLAQFANTCKEWADLGLKYWSLHTNGCNVMLFDDIGDGLSSIRFTNDPDVVFSSRQIAEVTLANLTQLTRIVLDLPQGNPQVVRFQHLKPVDTRLHEAIFRCPIEFDAPHSEIVFMKDYLDKPVSGRLTFLKPALATYMKHRIRQMPIHDQTATRNTMIAISSTLGTTKCNIAFIAESLGMNVKKLQRLLAIENTTFADVLDTARNLAARRMLVESNAPVSSIAG